MGSNVKADIKRGLTKRALDKVHAPVHNLTFWLYATEKNARCFSGRREERNYAKNKRQLCHLHLVVNDLINMIALFCLWM